MAASVIGILKAAITLGSLSAKVGYKENTATIMKLLINIIIYESLY